MVRRRPATVIGALCLSVALIGGPAVSVQAVAPGAGVEVSDLPVLSELPPLPANGDSPPVGDVVGDDSAAFGMSGVQTVAWALAAVALVAGGLGLAWVTLRGRGAVADERPRPADTAV